jgi:hypothetical protein
VQPRITELEQEVEQGATVCEWAYSTFHHYVQAGVYTDGWADTSDVLEEKGYGE